MSDILRFDKGQLKGKAEHTDEGYIYGNAVVTRTGVFTYQNVDGTLRRELRHPDDVFAADSLETLKMIPITIDHPAEMLVNAENADRLSVGQTGETVTVDGQNLMISLKITHKDAVEKASMGKKELSLGYKLDLEEEQGVYNGEPYDHRQRNITYNHLAMVDQARAGKSASLNLDSAGAVQVDAEPVKIETKTKQETKNMDKVNIDGINYDAAPEVANALNKSNARADKADKLAADLQVKLDEATAAKDTAEAERDTAKEATATATNGDAIAAAVKARKTLETSAEKVLNGDDAKDIENMDDAAIKAAVITAKFPDTNLDGKSEAYIDARFDTVMDLVNSDKSANDQRKSMGEVHGDGKAKDMGKEANDAFEAMKNHSKKK